MNTTQARALLERLAVQHGLRVAGISSVGESRSWTSRVLAEAAELRLSWRHADGHLTLELSHGPSDGESTGWLLLYGETCAVNELPEPDSAGRTFQESVLYGFDLMAPPRQ